MIVRLIIAKVYHDRVEEFVDLVKNRWAPMLEEHGGKFLGAFTNTEPASHEVVGLMRFNDMEHMERVNRELAADERFANLNQKMRPMLQNNEIRILQPA